MNILRELLEMSMREIDDSTDFLSKKFLTIGIIIKFSKHFGDRIIDGAKDEHGRRDNVTVEEMIDTFAKIYSHHKLIFIQASDFNNEVKRGEFEGVIKNVMKQVNIPYLPPAIQQYIREPSRARKAAVLQEIMK